MMEFLHALQTQQFLRFALLAGVLAGIAGGIVGAYVVARRISYMAGAVSHCVLGGIGAARYLQVTQNWSWLDPMYGAVASALLSAIIIGLVSLRAKQREDTVIGALWAIGMAIGVVFVSMTPGYSGDLNTWLFGNILMASREDLRLVAALDVITIVLAVGFYNRFMAVCFDAEFAAMRGLRVEMWFLLLLCLAALTIVALVKVVGIVLAIALLTLPVAIANTFTGVLWRVMLLGAGLCAVFTTVGLAFSYSTNLPAGAMIVLVAGAAYLLAAARGARA
ncbi:MAG: metal ABC transporter permease [Phycisphaerales bacterium]|nr:metal ABC transporter permease [Phycisphaerales bacterium]